MVQSGFPKNYSHFSPEQRFVCSDGAVRRRRSRTAHRAATTADQAAIAPARIKFSRFLKAVAVRNRDAARAAAPFPGRTLEVIAHESPDAAHFGEMALDLERP